MTHSTENKFVRLELPASSILVQDSWHFKIEQNVGC